MGHFILKSGKFVPADAHTTGEPVARGITPGHPPAGVIRNGLMDRLRAENLRKYDKASEQQIKDLVRQDEEELRKQNDVTPIVRQSKKDLESGKLRIEPGVLAGLNGKNYNKVVPFSSIQDERGITHVLPQDKVPVEGPITCSSQEIEALYQEMKAKLGSEKNEIVQASVGRAEAGNLPAIEEKDLIEGSIQAVKGNRAGFRGKTIT